MGEFAKHAPARCSALLILAALSAPAVAAPPYMVIDLGTPSGFPDFYASDVNSQGQVVGISGGQAGTTRGFLWSGGTFTQVPTGNGAPTWSYASAINDSGFVAGGGYGPPPAAFVWNTSLGTTSPIPDINASTGGSEGTHIGGNNERGAVVGFGWDFGGGGGYRSYLWQPHTPNGTTGDLVSLGGGGGSSVILTDVNDSGQIVGEGPSGGFLWNPTIPNGTSGTFFQIDPPAGFDSSSPAAVNNSGEVTGTILAGSPFGQRRGFLWVPDTPNGTNGTLIDLGELAPEALTFANDINSEGTIVGASGGRAFVWSAGDLMLDLNSLIDSSGADWILRSAVAISDTGLIVGTGRFDLDGPGGNDPVTRAFLLTPVPEPMTSALFSISLLLAGHRWPRRR